MSLISEYVKYLQGFMQKQFAVSFLIGEKTQKGDWLKLLFWINSQEICLEIHLCLSRMIHWLWHYLKKQNSAGADQQLSPLHRSFLYMPFMHSESLIIHEIARDLYEKNGIEANIDFEIKHQKVIKKFGRYPHRNKILGRVSTKEEIEFLKQPGSGF